jgi:4-carboxymuconolactone decarboxylase
MQLDTPRIKPIHEDDWSDARKQALGRQKIRGNVANIFRTLANHEKLAKRWMVFANHVLFKSTLGTRDREILILRIGWLCQSEYEWGQHVIIGKNAGMSDEEIASVKEGAAAACWTGHERLLIKATDELHKDAFVSDDTWNGLTETYSDEQMMDLVFTCGQYNLVSMALNSFGVQLDQDISGF